MQVGRKGVCVVVVTKSAAVVAISPDGLRYQTVREWVIVQPRPHSYCVCVRDNRVMFVCIDVDLTLPLFPLLLPPLQVRLPL